jgi:chromosome segregation ATPase
MNKNSMQLVIGALFILVGIAGFCVYQYIVSLQENASLQTELEQVQQDIRQLELVRDNLNSDLENTRESEKAVILENTGLKDQVKADQGKFTTLEATIQEAQNNIDALNAKISLAREENTALVTQIGGLKGQLSAVAQEKDQMEATLSSVDELKKAIKALKRKTRSARRAAPVTVVAAAKKQVREITLGNKGFLIKNGKIMTPSRVRIDVQPSPENKQ